MDKTKNLLSQIESPDDLKRLEIIELLQLSEEIRSFIIDELSLNPGHFGASLGVIELTVALHYVFNTPEDKIVWDVGHQAYAHKILTGRRKVFHTNRKYKGISGFPKMSESPYDSFGVGHSSTSISAALGIELANNRFQNKNNHVIAVIGDGSLTGGLAFEGLNNAGIEKTNLLVILNDNNMAIDPNSGALNEYLVDITTSKTYNKAKDEIWNLLGILNKLGPNARKYAQKVEHAIKSTILRQSNLFEALNFRYFGPVDGHDVVHLAKLLEDLKNIKGPKLLHCITKKGKGFKQAEENQTAFHAPGLFNKDTGEIIKLKSEKPQPPKYQDVFGYTLLELAKQNENIVGITPAMPTGCSLKIMMDEIPERTFDVGIAESHAVTFSAGLASQGILPYCNIYSSFMQRAFDQIIHDVAIQKLNVVLCLDRAGLVGEDGPTHHGAYDLSYLRLIPDITIASPMNEIELRNMMYTAQLPNKGPFAIRYPRGKGTITDWIRPFEELEIGKGRLIKEGNELAILTIGHTGNFVIEACKRLYDYTEKIAHYDMRFVKPIDEELLHEIFQKFNKIITIEDGTIKGGFGSTVIEFMAENGYHSKIIRLGIPDRFIEQGTPKELYKQCGFDVDNIVKHVEMLVSKKTFTKVI